MYVQVKGHAPKLLGIGCWGKLSTFPPSMVSQVTEFLSAKIADFGTSRGRHERRAKPAMTNGGGHGQQDESPRAQFEDDDRDAMTMTAVGESA